MSKGLIYLLALLGSLLGSVVPVWFGAGYFSFWSIFGGAIGSIAGIWAAVKVKDYI